VDRSAITILGLDLDMAVSATWNFFGQVQAHQVASRDPVENVPDFRVRGMQVCGRGPAFRAAIDLERSRYPLMRPERYSRACMPRRIRKVLSSMLAPWAKYHICSPAPAAQAGASATVVAPREQPRFCD